jgi:hypothetical protein
MPGAADLHDLCTEAGYRQTFEDFETIGSVAATSIRWIG